VVSETFRLLYPQERLLPVAMALTLVPAAFSVGTLRVIGIMVTLACALVWFALRASRPSLVVDERGYAVEKLGREALRVAWSEVKQVRADAAEEALYVDAGDPARNLLVPPRRGFGFRFEGSPRLFRLVLQHVPREKVESVDRLDATPQPKA
jgi:hypothetical protein